MVHTNRITHASFHLVPLTLGECGGQIRVSGLWMLRHWESDRVQGLALIPQTVESSETELDFKKNILHLTFRHTFPIFIFDNEAMSCSEDPFLVYNGASTARLPLVFLVPGVTFSQCHQPRKASFPCGCAAYNSLELLQKLHSQWLNSAKTVVVHILFRMLRMGIFFCPVIEHQFWKPPKKRALFFSCAQSGYIFCQMFFPGLDCLEDSI